MPTPIIANATKVTVIGQLFGQVVENVWAVQTADPPLVSDLDTINAIFQAGYGNIMLTLSQDYTVSEVTSRYMGSLTGPEATLTISPPQAGGSINPSASGSVCLCVSLRSGLAGRRFRGRKYFSGIPELSTAANVIDDALCDDVVSSIGGLIGDLAANGTPLSIISLVGLTLVPVVVAVCSDRFVDSQRRRLTGRGR